MTTYRSVDRQSGRKVKKSFTLSVESVQFLDEMREKRQAPSASSVLEEILQAARLEESRAAVERQVARYYDSLSPGEMKEQIDWGELAMREFPGAGV